MILNETIHWTFIMGLVLWVLGILILIAPDAYESGEGFVVAHA